MTHVYEIFRIVRYAEGAGNLEQAGFQRGNSLYGVRLFHSSEDMKIFI
jgi:hypothetical protein